MHSLSDLVIGLNFIATLEENHLVVVMGRLDQRSINRWRYGTIAFGH